MAKQRITARVEEPAKPDEAATFRAAVLDVKPLSQAAMSQAALPAGLRKPLPPARRRRPAADPVDLNIEMPLVGGDSASVAGGDALTFQRAGVRTQVVRRLRRGLFPIESELDLHGLTQSIAREYLARFIGQNRDEGRRCVRIIHGKGYRSGTRGPVLKMAIDCWLRRHPDVMAFTSARPIDGGTGAVYVLLRT